jgi:hypothetical protein
VCSLFFDKKLAACPDCGTLKRGVNIALVNSRWESNLNAHAAHAVQHS